MSQATLNPVSDARRILHRVFTLQLSVYSFA